MKTITLLVLLMSQIVVANAADNTKHTYKPKEGYVPNEKTAMAIAAAVWAPIYGEGVIVGARPYRAKLENGVWLVEATFPKGYASGAVIAEISKDDGRILRISPEK